MRIREGRVSWLNGVPSSGLRRSRRQEEEKPASGWRGSLLPPPDVEKSPERFSTGVRHPVDSFSMGPESPASRRKWGKWIWVPGINRGFFFFFSVEELTKQRNWEEEAETAESCLERVRRNNPVAISEQIWKLSGDREDHFLSESSWREDSIAQKKMLGKFLPDSTENFAELTDE